MPSDSSDAPKRFYTAAETGPLDGGYAVLLDGRAVRTASRARLVLPTRALADLVVEEWAAQGDVIRLADMRATRLAYTAADRVGVARAETIAEIVQFAGSDLLCYFAQAPHALVRRQEARWRPVLDWADRVLGVRLEPVAGIIHQPQPAESLVRIGDLCAAMDDFTLAGASYGTALYGSAVLTLAVFRDELGGEAAFDLSRLDEAFQEEQWGVDDEAALRTDRHRHKAVMLGRWFAALR